MDIRFIFFKIIHLFEMAVINIKPHIFTLMEISLLKLSDVKKSYIIFCSLNTLTFLNTSSFSTYTESSQIYVFGQ